MWSWALHFRKDGTTFEDYRREAQNVYRSAVGNTNAIQAVPSIGIHRQLTKRFKEQLNGTKKTLHSIDFRWVRLDEDELFRINHDDSEIQLNSNYRSALLGDRRGNVTDVPVLKLLLRKDKPVGDYVRCYDGKTCVLIERLFVANRVLTAIDEPRDYSFVEWLE